MRAWIDRTNDGRMPADGIGLPPQGWNLGTSRWGRLRGARLHQPLRVEKRVSDPAAPEALAQYAD